MSSTWSCHVALFNVSSNTRYLEKREIPIISEFNEIRLGNLNSRDEFNGEVRFIIRDLEKFQASTCTIATNYRFTNFQKKFIFPQILQFILKILNILIKI